jgi:MFS family permease
MAAPLYIAEISPAESRGTLVSLNQLCITLGILIAYVVAYLSKGDWRGMFAFAFVPIVVQFIGLFFVPESAGRKPASTSWRALLEVKLPFLIGIGIAVFQSITGINTVIYYAPTIFELVGFSEAQTALLATVLVGVVNVVVTVLALWLIDRVGRRPLLIGGLSGMGLALVILGASFVTQQGNLGLAALLGFVAFFAVSLGPVAWLIISEVYPEGIRGRAMGIATFSNWLCNYVVSLTFLSLIQEFGTAGTFWIYAFICFLGLWFVIKLVPETKGKTFEQIQQFWKRP